MVTREPAPETATAAEFVFTDAGELLRWQLLVARRADVLARESPPATPEADRRLWLRAELDALSSRAGLDSELPRSRRSLAMAADWRLA